MPGFELVGDEERAAVASIFADGGVLVRHGFDGQRRGRYRVAEFEAAFAEWMGQRHAVAVSSGTAALKVGLKALGVGPGDEVITQAFTFIATVEAIADCGATPVIVNIDDTLNMDPPALQRAITERTRTIVPVHMLGVSARIDEIHAIAQSRNIAVLDDNCESLGASWAEQKLGAQADACVFSLDAGKVITCGEGGVVTTDDAGLAALAREYHDHGHQGRVDLPRGMDTRRIPGFNYRLTELQAAVALAQLQKLDQIVSINRRNYSVVEQALADVDGLKLRAVPTQCSPLCDTLIFLMPTAEHASAVVERMAAAGMPTKNLPDALGWHFAGDWDHLAPAMGLTPEELADAVIDSRRLLERAVAFPIMVTMAQAELTVRAERLRSLCLDVLR